MEQAKEDKEGEIPHGSINHSNQAAQRCLGLVVKAGQAV